MIQVVIIILFIIFLVYSIRFLNRSETYTINKLYISWENKNYIEESVDKWILVLENSNGDELHKIENIDVSNRKNFEPVNIPFIENKDFDEKIFGDNKVKVYYNQISDINLVLTTNITFSGTDFGAELSNIKYADSNIPNQFVHHETNIARYVWYGYENSTVKTIWSPNEKIVLTEMPIQTIAVYFDGKNITQNLGDNSIESIGRWEDPSYNIHPVSSSDGPIRKIFKDSPARDNRTDLQNATWFKSEADPFHGEGKYTSWIQIDLGKEYPIDNVVVDRGSHGEGGWKGNWAGTFVKLKNTDKVEVSRSTDKVPDESTDAGNYKEDGLTKGIKTFTFPKKSAKVDCIGIGGDVWGTCTQTCGDKGKQTKTFKISAPARNGGSCPSESEEQPCNRKLCGYSNTDNNFEYIRYSPTSTFILSDAKGTIEASESKVTKADVTDFTNLKSATDGFTKIQNYLHYWRIRYTFPESTLTREDKSVTVKGFHLVTIETDSDDNKGYVLVNNKMLGAVSSKGTIGGGQFKGGSYSNYGVNFKPYVDIDIFFYHKKNEPTNNDVRILFKGPGMNSFTYDFKAYKNLKLNPPKHSSDFTPPPPPVVIQAPPEYDTPIVFEPEIKASDRLNSIDMEEDTFDFSEFGITLPDFFDDPDDDPPPEFNPFLDRGATTKPYEPAACQVSFSPANGTMGTCESSLESGSTCQPTCNTGYTVSGTSSCNDGMLSAATCSANPCDASAAPANGAVGLYSSQCTSTLPSGSTCQPTCNTGYTVSGTSSCTLGTLTAATCVKTPTYTVSHSTGTSIQRGRDRDYAVPVLTVKITNIKNAHSSFTVTLVNQWGTTRKTRTLAKGDTGFTWTMTDAQQPYGSYTFVIKLNGTQTDTFTAVFIEPPPPPSAPKTPENLTANSSGKYTVSDSDGSSDAWKAFDGKHDTHYTSTSGRPGIMEGYGVMWDTASVYSRFYPYKYKGSEYKTWSRKGGWTPSTYSKKSLGGVEGEWIKIKLSRLPNAFTPQTVRFQTRSKGKFAGIPSKWVTMGSNDDANWTILHTENKPSWLVSKDGKNWSNPYNQTWSNYGLLYEYSFKNVKAYSYLAIVVTHMDGTYKNWTLSRLLFTGPKPPLHTWIEHKNKKYNYSGLKGKFVNSDDIPGESTTGESRVMGLSVDECKLMCNDLEHCNSIQHDPENFYTSSTRGKVITKQSECLITSATVSGTGKPEDTTYFTSSATPIFQKSKTKSYLSAQEQYLAEQQAMTAAWSGGR